MARTKSILTGEEFKNKRTLLSMTAANLQALRAMGVSGTEFALKVPLTPEEESEFLKYVWKERQQTQSGWRNLTNASIVFLAEVRGYSAAMAKFLGEYVKNYQYNELRNEGQLLSVQMLNEFLAQDEFQVYGEFLDKHWDELYDRTVNLDFTEYSWTPALLKEHDSPSVLTFRPQLPKVAMKELEALTKEQIVQLRLEPSIGHAVPNSSARSRLKSLLAVISGEQTLASPVYQVINRFISALNKTMLQGSQTTSISYFRVYKMFLEILEESKLKLTNERAKSRSDCLFTNDVERYADFLLNHAEKFTPHEMFFACIAWDEFKLITRTGTREDIMKFFMQVLDRYGNSETSVEFFRMVGEAGASYNNELPTMTQWKKALADELLDDIFDCHTTLALVSGSSTKVEKLIKHKDYRKAFTGE